MYMGHSEHSLDSKNRLIMPAKFREKLGEEFVLTVGLDSSLFVYDMDAWQRQMEKLAATPDISDADIRQWVRNFIGFAETCTLDKMGRVYIPDSLRKYARLEKDVIIHGVISRIELWNKDIWEEYNKDFDLSKNARALSPYNI